jgi:cell wall-associated NlpC family hydrolase
MAAIALLASALAFSGTSRALAAPAASSVAAEPAVSKAALMPAAPAAVTLPLRLRAYAWAARKAGCRYAWGGTSCAPGFDCSGLVETAYARAGISLPRTTYAMLGSPRLHRVWHPRMGDLAFYGSGHVELFRRWRWTFGAHDSGTRVGLIHYGWGWAPTAFYRVR